MSLQGNTLPVLVKVLELCSYTGCVVRVCVSCEQSTDEVDEHVNLPIYIILHIVSASSTIWRRHCSSCLRLTQTRRTIS